MTPERRQVVDAARGYLGAKWRHRARTPWAIDCIGLLVKAFEAAGLDIQDRTDYSREPWNDNLQQALRERFGAPRYVAEPPVTLAGCQPGDVALFRWMGKAPCHVGILGDYAAGGLSLIHAHSNFNVAEHGLDARWRRLLVEVYDPWHK